MTYCPQLAEVRNVAPPHPTFFRINRQPGFYTIRVITSPSHVTPTPFVAELGYTAIEEIFRGPGYFEVNCRTVKQDAAVLLDVAYGGITFISVKQSKTSAVFSPISPIAASPVTTVAPAITGTTPVIPANAVTSMQSLCEAGYEWSDSCLWKEFTDLSKENLSVLDSHITAAFPAGRAEPNEKATCLELLSYIAQVMLITQPNPIPPGAYPQTGTCWLQVGGGNCYYRSLALCALIRRVGIPCRVIYIPEANHVITEAYWDSSWHVLDPSYGTVLMSCKEGHYMSIAELKQADPAVDYVPCTTVTNLWTGIYTQRPSVGTMPDTFTSPNGWPVTAPKWPTWKAWYTEAFVSSTTVGLPYFAGFSRVFPLILDFSTNTALKYGPTAIGFQGYAGTIQGLFFKNAPAGNYLIVAKFFAPTAVHQPFVVGANVVESKLDTTTGTWFCKIAITDPNQIVLVNQTHNPEAMSQAGWAVDSLTIYKL